MMGSKITDLTPKIWTIGVYGFTASGFFNALKTANVDLFCDVRLRRGMRGNTYSFVNSKKLQDKLAEIDIRYIHCLDLAPSQDTRDLQKQDDENEGSLKSTRTFLSSRFITAYDEQCLSNFDSNLFFNKVCGKPDNPVFFCVEREPMACHRHLIAERLAMDLKLNLEHIKP